MKPVSITVKNEDTAALLSWIKNVDTTVRDLRPLWETMKPIISKQVETEFTAVNPNQWQPLTPQYREEKVAAGYPDIIGVRTGSLKWASSKGAKMDMTAKVLTWKVDGSVVNSEGLAVSDYMFDFNSLREQFKYTVRYVNKSIKMTISKWLKDAIGDIKDK